MEGKAELKCKLETLIEAEKYKITCLLSKFADHCRDESLAAEKLSDYLRDEDNFEDRVLFEVQRDYYKIHLEFSGSSRRVCEEKLAGAFDFLQQLERLLQQLFEDSVDVLVT